MRIELNVTFEGAESILSLLHTVSLTGYIRDTRIKNICICDGNVLASVERRFTRALLLYKSIAAEDVKHVTCELIDYENKLGMLTRCANKITIFKLRPASLVLPTVCSGIIVLSH